MNMNQEIPHQTAPIENESTGIANDVPAESGALERAVPSRTPVRTLLGVFFLTISVVGASGLVVAYVPAFSAPKVNVAAAAQATPSENFTSLSLQAGSVYVYDATDDRELFAKNPSAQLPLASLTKVMLALVVAEVLKPEDIVTITKEAVERGGGGLTWGEAWKARDLIDYTLVTSSNTGAEALADAANSLLLEKYPNDSQLNASVWRMNALAAQLGLHETYFINVTGLDESPTQAGAQGSAKDIASLFAYALRTNRELFARTAESDILLGPNNFPERDAHNTNMALVDIEGLVMGKTGTTDLAGGNLAIAFYEKGHLLVVVVLGSTPEGRFDDVKALAAAARISIE